MTRRELIQKNGMTTEIWLSGMIPSAAMLAGICYPELSQEYTESNDGRLFSCWVAYEYPELISFLRSLSAEEKTNLIIATLDESM